MKRGVDYEERSEPRPGRPPSGDFEPRPTDDCASPSLPDVRTRDRTLWLTAADLRNVVFFLALPVLGEQMLATCVGLVDTWLAGRISKDATAAVGFAAYVGWLANMLFMLVATGTTALVSRLTGARQHTDANHVANQSIAAVSVGGAMVFVMIYALAPTFATLQGLTGTPWTIVVEYLRIDAAGFFLMGCTVAGAAALRGVGDMKTPLIVLAVVNVINIIVSVTITFGWGPIPAFGVRGIAIGTVTARCLGGILTLLIFAIGRSGLRLRGAFIVPHASWLRRIFRIGIPAMLNGAVMWTAHFFFLMVIGRLAEGEIGTAYYAAHMIAIRLEAFTYLPAVAWGTAGANLVGQALGAGNVDRAKRVAHVAVGQCLLLNFVVVTCYLIWSESIFRIMQDDPLVAAVGAQPFRILALFQPLLVIGIIYINSLQGAGDTRSPLVYTLAGTLLLRLPLAYLCGIVLDGGLAGAWVGMYSDMAARGVFGFCRYTFGHWYRTEV